LATFKEYKKEIMDAAHDKGIRTALSRAIKSYRANTNEALRKFPHTIEMAEEVLKIKEKAVGEMEELARKACQAIEDNKGKAYIARTADDALDIISKLVGEDKLIVKGKSMTGEEIGLREHLEEKGNEVYETDLGEFIIQKLGSRPMHILSPSIHVPHEDVARLFSKVMGKELSSDSDIAEMVAAAREFLQDYVPRSYADAKYFINLAILKTHARAGITICAKNFYGSLIRKPTTEGYYSLHTGLLECTIEGNPMAISLGIGENTVAIEQNRIHTVQ